MIIIMGWVNEVFSKNINFGTDLKIIKVDNLPIIGEEKVIYNLGNGETYVWDEFLGKKQYILWLNQQRCPQCGHKI